MALFMKIINIVILNLNKTNSETFADFRRCQGYFGGALKVFSVSILADYSKKRIIMCNALYYF